MVLYECAMKHDFERFSVYNFIRRIEWDVLEKSMKEPCEGMFRTLVTKVFRKIVSTTSGYIPMKELFRTRDVHRKSHQGAIKSAHVAASRRIVFTLHFSWLFHAFANAAADATRTSVEARWTYRKRSLFLYIFISNIYRVSLGKRL